MQWTLEVVPVPTTDVDVAKRFYADQVGFVVDFDTSTSSGARFVQLTPPGSGCSIVLGSAADGMAPGSLRGLQLVVADVRRARDELARRAVEVSPVEVYDVDGPRPYRDGDELNNVGFIRFADPDGNQWAVQQIDNRT